MRVAIIGAGVSGLSCANTLRGHAEVVLFDKARGPWGRLASRANADSGESWDFGAQYFTARSDAFRGEVDRLLAVGTVAEWQGRIVALALQDDASVQLRDVGGGRRFVGVPSMRALALHWANDLTVHTSSRVIGLEPGPTWTLTTERGERHPDFDAVVIALPSHQASVLLSSVVDSTVPPTSRSDLLRAAVASVRLTPCWAAMASFDAPVPLPFDGAFVGTSETHLSPLAWVARDSSKPDRPAGERWVLHASPAWSEQHLEDDADTVARLLSHAFTELAQRLDITLPTSRVQVHRWRYAQASNPLDVGALWDTTHTLGICGDWCMGNRVEGAWLSGRRAADDVLAHLQSASVGSSVGHKSRMH